MKLIAAIGIMLMAASAHSQGSPKKQEAQKTNELQNRNSIETTQQTLTTSNLPIPGETVSNSIAQPFPLKPEPSPVYLGQWIAPGEPMGKFSDDLILTDRKDDGKFMWHVEKVGTCAWCGRPMGWKEAALDKKSSSLWALRSALFVADIEVTHHAPCFSAGACRELNPLLGQTRAQAYSVTLAMNALFWWGTAWERKGDKANHIGGSKYWWLIPVVGQAASAVGIAANLARWNQKAE